MIAGYSTSCPCPGSCDRRGDVTLNTGNCKTCRSRKPARALPVYVFSRTKDGSSKVVLRRAA